MTKLKKLKNFYNRYERYLIPGALIFGFVTDVLTFRFIDFNLAMALLLAHLIFIGINISVINFYEAQKIAGKFFSFWRILAPLFLQYSFGNLFSAFLIFYSHSGSVFASWPFIVVIVFLMIGNEIFRKYNVRPAIQISVYFFAVFSYLSLLFPSILNNLSEIIFIGAGIISLAFIVSFAFLLGIFISHVREKLKVIFISVGSIFLTMNFLYFFNFIPPIPLSIQKIDAYHHIERAGDGYFAIGEDCEKWHRCFFSLKRLHIVQEREAIYVFSAIFAPQEMKLEASHEWQKYSKEKNRWETVVDMPFSIVGGREGGYRWYTYNTISPGRWRVNVKTKRGQIIGRKDFYVVRKEGVSREEERL